jgi:hypothetical protein
MGGYPFVGIDEIHPLVPEAVQPQSEFPLARIAQPGLLDYLSAQPGCDLQRAVGRARVDDQHLVRPGHRLQAPGDIQLLVLGEDDHGDRHAVLSGEVAALVRAQPKPGHRGHPRSQSK